MWWWWNVIGCVVTVVVGVMLGRADQAAVAVDSRPGRRLALGLLAFFGLIVAVLVGIQLAVG